MDFLGFAPETFLSFLLTLMRVSLLLFMLPFFGGDSVPKPVKGALCIVMALALHDTVGVSADYFPAHPVMLVVMILGELLLGIMLSLVVRFIFAAVQTGGQLIGFQMGFSMVNVVDPMTGTSEAVTAHFLYMTTLLVFLCLDGHLLLLHALTESFRLVPPGELLLSAKLSSTILEFSSQMFYLAVKVAAPVMAAIFLVDLALALVGRAAPQMNILMIGFPLKISVGFFFLALLFTVLSLYVNDYLVEMPTMFTRLLLEAR